MVPDGVSNMFITYVTSTARKLYRFLCIKHIMENGNMPLVAFI